MFYFNSFVKAQIMKVDMFQNIFTCILHVNLFGILLEIAWLLFFYIYNSIFTRTQISHSCRITWLKFYSQLHIDLVVLGAVHFHWSSAKDPQSCSTLFVSYKGPLKRVCSAFFCFIIQNFPLLVLLQQLQCP